MTDHSSHEPGEWRWYCEACSGLPNNPEDEQKGAPMTDHLREVIDGIRERLDHEVSTDLTLNDDSTYDDARKMLAALEWMQEKHGIDDPCPPRTCSHADCEITNGLTEHLGSGRHR